MSRALLPVSLSVMCDRRENKVPPALDVAEMLSKGNSLLWDKGLYNIVWAQIHFDMIYSFQLELK